MKTLKQTTETTTIKKGYLKNSREGEQNYCIITNDCIKIYPFHPSITPTPLDEIPIIYKNGQAIPQSMHNIKFYKQEIK